MKEIFYYNRKFPEYPIRKMKVKDMLYVIGKKDKWLYSIISSWNIEMDCKEDWDRSYHVYSPYEDKEILIWENNLNNEYAMSFNKKLIEDWYKEDCEILKHKLQERLDKLNNLGAMLSETNR